jgi:hypothetical protein
LIEFNNGKTKTCFVEFEILTAVVMKSPIIWDIPLQPVQSQLMFLRKIMPPSSMKKVGSKALFAVCSFKTSDDFQRATQHYIPV